MNIVDLFCGAGGLSEGFRQAGYSVLVGNDYNDAAGRTFKASHKNSAFLNAPIGSLSERDFIDAAPRILSGLDCLVGGPACQGFSVNNHNRGMQDARSHLFRDYLRIVKGLMPNWVVLENVTGMKSAGGGAVVQEIHEGLQTLGYTNVECRVLNAEEYGVPQKRRRMIFIGNRLGLQIVWPEKTHGEGKAPLNTIQDAIGDLPALKNGESYECGGYAKRPIGEYQRLMRKGSRAVLNHWAPKLGQINLDRMKHIPPGGSWRDIPFELLPAGMQRAKRSDHTKRYGRMTWDSQSSTVLTKCDVHWGAYIHPEQDRSISVREAARLQSFPDRFEFKGSRTEQYVQVGNAVPPLLGKAIALAIGKATAASARAIQLVAAE